MDLRTSSTDLGDLRKIWEGNCYVRSQPLAPAQTLSRTASEDLYQGRLRHANSVEGLREATSDVADWWSAFRNNSTEQRKLGPVGNRQREDIFGGSYDSGAGYYDTSNMFNKRSSRIDSAPSIYSGSASTSSFGDDLRRSSSASTWEASSGYSSDRTSPRERLRESPFSDPDRFSPTRGRQLTESSSFFEALNSIGHQQQQQQQEQQDRLRRNDQRILEQEYQRRQQKLQQEELENDRKKNSRQDVQRLCKLLSSFILEAGEEATEKPAPSTSKLDRILTLKQMLGEELNSLSRSKPIPCPAPLDAPTCSRYRGTIGQQVPDKSSPLASSLNESSDLMSLMRNKIPPSRPLNPYEAALEIIEREAKQRRTSAFQSNAPFTWKGSLTPRYHTSPTYASKVFVGGLPYDVSAEMLTEIFSKFGASVQLPPRGRGHAYLVFDSDMQVQALLNACESKGPGQFYYWVPSRRGKDRKAQVIPWVTEDSDWITSDTTLLSKPSLVMPPSSESDAASDASIDTRSTEEISSFDSASSSPKDPPMKSDSNIGGKQNTIFVGALHGEITAEGLQKILSDLFGPIIHVGIDTDKSRYPNGSARVTFATSTAFRRAVLAEYVHVVTPRFSKTIQLDAYIEDGTCSICRNTTPVFCRHPDCFRYYCATCFIAHRADNGDYHPPVMRNRNVTPSPMASSLPAVSMNSMLTTHHHPHTSMLTQMSSSPGYIF